MSGQLRLLAASIAKAMAMAASNLSAKPVAWISAQYFCIHEIKDGMPCPFRTGKRSEKARAAEKL